MRLFDIDSDIQNIELESTVKKRVRIGEDKSFHIFVNKDIAQVIKSDEYKEVKIGAFLARKILEKGTDLPMIIFKYKEKVHKEYIESLYKRSVLGLQEGLNLFDLDENSIISKRYSLLDSTDFGFKKIRSRLTEKFSRSHKFIRKDIPNEILEDNSKRRKINNIIHQFRDRYLRAYKRESLFIKEDSYILQDIYFPFIRLGISFSKEIEEPSLDWIKIRSGRLYRIKTPSLVKNSDIDKIYDLIIQRLIIKF